MSPRVKQQGGVPLKSKVPSTLTASPTTYTPDEIYRTYLKWLVTPKNHRNPANKELFCLAFGITIVDIQEMQDRASFAEDLLDEMLDWARRRTPEIIQGLYERFEKKEASAADLKLWLETIYPDRSKPSQSTPPATTQNIINVFNPTDEQRRQIFERGAKRIASDATRSEE